MATSKNTGPSATRLLSTLRRPLRRRPQSRRVVAAIAAGALTLAGFAAVAVAAPGGPHGSAPRPTTSAQAKQQLTALGQQLDAVDEDYNAAQLLLGKQTADAKAADAKLAGLRKQVGVLQGKVRQMASSAYQNGQLSGFSAFVSSSSPQDLLDRLGDLDMISAQNGRTLQALNQSRAQAVVAAAQAKRAEAGTKASETQVAAKRTVLTGQVKQMNKLMSTLSARELAAWRASIARQNRIAAQQQAKQQQAAQQLHAKQQAAAHRQAELRAEASASASRSAASSASATPVPTRLPSSAPPAPSSTYSPPSSLATTAPPASRAAPVTTPPTPAPTTPPSTPPSPSPTSPPSPSPTTPPSRTAPAPSSQAQIAVAAAEAEVGKPYAWGAAGPDSFDCSGLMLWAWAKAGVNLPHSSAAQYGFGTHVSHDELQPGDLVFYYSPIHHVAMYVGKGMVIHAPDFGVPVGYAPVDSMPYVGATRLS